MALLRSFSNRFMVPIHAQKRNKPFHEPTDARFGTTPLGVVEFRWLSPRVASVLAGLANTRQPLGFEAESRWDSWFEVHGYNAHSSNVGAFYEPSNEDVRPFVRRALKRHKDFRKEPWQCCICYPAGSAG